MSVQVKSEIGNLKRIMLHRPGRELEQLVPGELERLLFDDIPYLKIAQKEHDFFADTLKEHGVEVVYLENLAAEVLDLDPALREQFIKQFINEGGSAAHRYKKELFDYFDSIEDSKELIKKTMSGIRLNELDARTRLPLTDLIKSKSRFVLDPIPNLYFVRDPFAFIGCGVSLNHMYALTRRRETIYGEYILSYHPDFCKKTPWYYWRDMPFSIEGGDILNLSPKVLAIGLSQRTSPEAIELLAQNIFQNESSEIDTILVFDIPNIRAYMHLDTVFTQIDYDKFTIHPGILKTLRVYELKKSSGKTDAFCVRELQKPLAQLLPDYLEISKASLIQCGGRDRIASEREQWNDGSNTLCISPGKVIVYDRNYITNEILRNNGIEVLEIPGSELSRGRGGPRCMSMPLFREGGEM